MSGLFVKNYLLDQKEAFFKNYSAAFKSKDVDAVHDTRVSVKRLRTLVRMLNYNESANFRLKKCFDPIQTVYRKFGPLRDFQIISMLLAEYQDKMDYEVEVLLSNCNQKIKFQVNQIDGFSKFRFYHSIKRSLRLIEFYLETESIEELTKRIIDFKKNRDQLIKVYSDKTGNKYNLHRARKMFKDIAYLMEMSENEMPDFASELKLYKQFGSLLGNWNDRSVLSAYLKNEQKRKELQNQDLEKIYATINKEKDDLEKEYFSLIAKW